MKKEFPMSDELRKYSIRKPIGWYISSVIFACYLLMFFIFAIAGSKVEPIGVVIFLAGFAISILFIMRNTKQTEKIMEDVGQCARWDSDFSKAVPMRNGKIKFGDEWIFIKGCLPLGYDEIVRVYQYIHRTNFIENERALKYVNTAGKHRKLCNLELRDKSKDEMMQMVAIICSKNPSVKIGYR